MRITLEASTRRQLPILWETSVPALIQRRIVFAETLSRSAVSSTVKSCGTVEALNVDLRGTEGGKRRPGALQICYSRTEAAFRKVLSDVVVLDRRRRNPSAPALARVRAGLVDRARDVVCVSAAAYVRE